MLYIESGSTDPRYNLALEQYAFDEIAQKDELFMLWQNDNAIIIGKHQNTFEEINIPYVKSHGIQVVRRLSGGGAVYHDMGNVNFTFIAPHSGASFDFSSFCKPVMKALNKLGVTVELSGRNDMSIDGRKFSGNSQYIKQGRIMHHGTLMFDSNLETVENALRVCHDKYLSKGFNSVRSSVTNISEHLPEMYEKKSISEFIAFLKAFLYDEYHFKPYFLTTEDIKEINAIKESVYDKWSWNFGESPKCSVVKKRRAEGCGHIEIRMDVENGKIVSLHFYGDYFGNKDSEGLAEKLIGTELNEEAVMKKLEGVNLEEYFDKLGKERFCEILLS